MRVCVFYLVMAVFTSGAVSTRRGRDMNQLPKKWTPMHLARWKKQAPVDGEGEEEGSQRSIPMLPPSTMLAPRLLRSSASTRMGMGDSRRQ